MKTIRVSAAIVALLGLLGLETEATAQCCPGMLNGASKCCAPAVDPGCCAPMGDHCGVRHRRVRRNRCCKPACTSYCPGDHCRRVRGRRAGRHTGCCEIANACRIDAGRGIGCGRTRRTRCERLLARYHRLCGGGDACCGTAPVCAAPIANACDACCPTHCGRTRRTRCDRLIARYQRLCGAQDHCCGDACVNACDPCCGTGRVRGRRSRCDRLLARYHRHCCHTHDHCCGDACGVSCAAPVAANACDACCPTHCGRNRRTRCDRLAARIQRVCGSGDNGCCHNACDTCCDVGCRRGRRTRCDRLAARIHRVCGYGNAGCCEAPCGVSCGAPVCGDACGDYCGRGRRRARRCCDVNACCPTSCPVPCGAAGCDNCADEFAPVPAPPEGPVGYFPSPKQESVAQTSLSTMFSMAK